MDQLNQLDVVAIALLGVAAAAAVGSFSVIANYLFANDLADRRDPFPNIIALCKKYRDHTRDRTGRVDPWFWILIAAVGVFIVAGMAYVILRFI